MTNLSNTGVRHASGKSPLQTPQSTPAPPSTPASLTRRTFVAGVAAFSLASAAHAELSPLLSSNRILVGSGTPNGILSFAWDAATGTLHPEGIAAVVSHSTWLELSPDRRYLYVACELEEFQGKPTGAVASYALSAGRLTPIAQIASQGAGTCHVNTDMTGRTVLCANYSGGSSTSFTATDGKLAEAWHEAYTGSGPVADRQEKAHAHFASFSPDNRFAYINDLGSDQIHIYKLDAATARLTAAGAYHAKPGDGPRTLHFHAHGKVAYCVNELNSSVTVLQWNPTDGSLTPIQTVNLLAPGTPTKHGDITNTGCDAVLSRDGKFAYFANRGDDFIVSFHIDPASAKLTPFADHTRIPSGGKTPRNFRLDPTERWMLVANQTSSNLSIFPRDPTTGILTPQGKNYPAATPMCIVFV